MTHTVTTRRIGVQRQATCSCGWSTKVTYVVALFNRVVKHLDQFEAAS